MKKMFKGIISVLAATALMLPNMAVYAEEGDPAPAPAASSTLTNASTATLKLTGAKKKDKFNAYKIIDINYDSAKNSITYDWIPELSSFIKAWDNDPTTTFTVEEYRKKDADERRSILAKLHNYIIENKIPPANSEPVEALAVEEGSDVGVATFTEMAMGGYLIAAVQTTDVYQLAFKAIEPTVDEESNQYTLKNITFSVAAKHTPMNINKTANKQSAQTNETITYTILADVPAYGTNSIDKAFSIKDVLPASLDIDAQSIKVYSHIDNVAASAEGWVEMAPNATYTLTTNPETLDEGEHVSEFTIDIRNIKDGTAQFDAWYSYTVTENTDGSFKTDYTANKKKIKIVYTAVLNGSAEIASKQKSETDESVYTVGKNTNKATLTFYPYPYVYETNEDGTISTNIKTQTKTADYSVYTYGIEIMKYASGNDENLLSGAKFQLYSAATIDEDNNKITGVDESSKVTGYYYRTSSADPWSLAKESTVLETVGGYVYIKGLKAGTTYYLKETAAPSGYNLPEVPVIAVSTALAENSHVLKDTEGDVTDEFKEAANKGYVLAKIDNSSGFTLPSTGGTGVLILKVLGVIAMAAAVIVVAAVLIRPKKRAK